MSFNFQTMAKRNPSDFMATSRIPIRGAEVKEGFSRIPMFVADMSFECAPSITEALVERIGTPAYGYFPMQDAYYDAILNWQITRNHFEGLTRDMIGYENGVLGGVTSALKALCPQGGKVLVHTPVYIGFTGTLKTCDEGVLEWIAKDALHALPQWEGDRIFLRLLEQRVPFFSLKLVYTGEHLTQAVLNGEVIR